MLRSTGYHSSGFDQRDWTFEAPDSLNETQLRVPFPRDQADVPCCVSLAVITCMEVLDARSGSAQRLSPLFNYYLARERPTELTDIEPRRALQVATSSGVCEAGLHPEADICSRADALRAPGAAGIDDARERRIFSAGRPGATRQFGYERLQRSDRVAEWSAAIGAGLPILFAFYITPGYHRLTKKNSKLVLRGDEVSELGHVVVAFGISSKSFMVQDWRGPSFARRGTWLLPFELAASSFVVEAWVVKRITYD